MAKFVKLLKNIEGATAIEYSLIAALIAVAAIGAMQGIGSKVNTTFNNRSNPLGSNISAYNEAAVPKGAAALRLRSGLRRNRHADRDRGAGGRSVERGVG